MRRLRRIADLRQRLDGRHVASVSAGPCGEAIVLHVEPADAVALAPRFWRSVEFASSPSTRAAYPYTAKAVLHDGREVVEAELRDVDLAFPILQSLPGGDWLVIGSRCLYTPAYAPGRPQELNAYVYSPEGELVRTFLVGDGIEDVQCSLGGDVWVSYFDEGIYGNYGWGSSFGGPPPVGAASLVRFDALGNRTWEFDAPDEIADDIDYECGLNVGLEEVWALWGSLTPEPDLPLTRIDQGGRIQTWRNPSGAGSFVVADRRVCFHWDGKGLVGELADGAVEVVGSFKLVLPDLQPWPRKTALIARGAEFRGFRDGVWYGVDAEAL